MIARLVHIMLSVVIFVGSTGVVFNKHYCQNQLKSSAVFFHAIPCYAKEKTQGCPMHAAMQMAHQSNAGGCCDDRVDFVKSDNDKISPFIHTLSDLAFDLVPAFCAIVLEPTVSFDTRTIHYLNYKPPLIVCDPHAELQTFLC